MARSMPTVAGVFQVLCMLRCAAGLSTRGVAQHKSDPNGVFYTRPVPSTMELRMKTGRMTPLMKAPFSMEGNTKVWLVAGTRDGGPLANLYFPPLKLSRSGICEVRNFHEEIGDRQCMHWQVEDKYDAEWYHACLDPDDYWVDSNEVALQKEGLRLQQSTSLLSVGTNQTAHEALRANYKLGDGITVLVTDSCGGSPFMLNMLDLGDSKGLEVVWQGGPNFPDECMEMVGNYVKQYGLEDWNLQRCNIDGGRKLEDFPWPQGSGASDQELAEAARIRSRFQASQDNALKVAPSAAEGSRFFSAAVGGVVLMALTAATA